MSAAVKTPTTPSAAAAALVSMAVTSAQAWSVRRSGVQHARDPHVVDVVAVAERQLTRLVLRTGRANASTECRLERLALGDRLDGVEDLDVAGAAAQVGARCGAIPPVEVGALLVDLGLGAHHDAGDAGLQPATAANASA